MSDPISNAISRTRTQGSQARTTASNVVSSRRELAQNSISNKISDYPVDKDPAVLKRQVEAKVQEKQALIQEQLIQKKEESISQARDRISSVRGMFSRPSFKLPNFDRKILLKVATAKILKKIEKEKSKLSKANIERGETAFSFPITRLEPRTPTLNRSSLPVPQKPSIPRLPFKK